MIQSIRLMQKIMQRSMSPDEMFELVVYTYTKEGVRLRQMPKHISVISAGEALPKYGNFYIDKYDFDCISKVDWSPSQSHSLMIEANSGCYHAFHGYLVANGPSVDFELEESGDG